MKASGLALALGLALASPLSQAAVTDEVIEALKEQIAALNARVAELERSNQQTAQAVQQTQQTAQQASRQVAEVADQVEAATAGDAASSWAERIAIKGDFRYRYQNDEISDNVATALGDSDSRNRQRVRARAEITARLPGDVKVGLGIASGGDDPVSTNQTLGGGGSTKDINMDLAYFTWTGLSNTALSGGKIKNSFETVGGSQLQWDGDWRPEGADLRWDNGTFFAEALGTWLESDSNSSNTEFAWLAQAGARAKLGPIGLKGGVGYTEIDAAGKPCFFEDDDYGLCLGNQVGPGGNYLYDFEVYNLFGEASLELAGLPLTIFADFVKNDAADDFDTGYLVGAQLGSAKQKGSWSFQYYYESLESNATLALLTNSDFGGGGTNGEGSVFSGAYALTEQTNIRLTYFLVDRNTDNLAAILGGEEFDFDTLQLDFNFKYK